VEEGLAKICKLTLLRQLDEVQLLTLLRPRNVSGEKRIHEGLEIRPPPLRKRITDLPVFIDAFPRELGSHRRQTLVQSLLESFNLVILEVKIITWSLAREALALV
jgi:hypothetical protein